MEFLTNPRSILECGIVQIQIFCSSLSCGTKRDWRKWCELRIILIVRNMFRLAILLNPPGPLFKGGTYEGLKPYQNTYGRNEQCRSESVPPFSKRGARGDFILSHTPSNRNMFMTSAITIDWGKRHPRPILGIKQDFLKGIVITAFFIGPRNRLPKVVQPRNPHDLEAR